MKLLLIAGSTLALVACGGAEVETAEVESQENSAEVLASEEQPPLEGDSPFVDDADVAQSDIREPVGIEPVEPLETTVPATTLAGTYDVEIEGLDETKELMIDQGETTGMFGDEPIQVSMTGEEFSFDAPVMMNDEEQLMTFTGTFAEGEIQDGMVEAQGDGTSKSFTATRTGEPEAALGEPATNASSTMGEDLASPYGSSTEELDELESTDEYDTEMSEPTTTDYDE